MEKTVICIECPNGCEITVKGDPENLTISGNLCPRGKEYAKNEMICPRRVLTSTVKVGDKVLPVKSDKPLKKSDMFKVMEIINSTEGLSAPISIGDVLIKDVVENINIVATDNII